MKKDITIALDIDGILRNFIQSVQNVFLEDYPNEIKNIKAVTSWNLQEFYPPQYDIYDYVFNKKPMEIMFLKAVSYNNEIRHEKRLSQKYGIALVTSQTATTIIPTMMYIKAHKIKYDSIHFVTSAQKQIVDADFYIDDSPYVLQELLDTNETVFAFWRPWNAEFINNNSNNNNLMVINSLAEVESMIGGTRD